jgi:hypothetical protein
MLYFSAVAIGYFRVVKDIVLGPNNRNVNLILVYFSLLKIENDYFLVCCTLTMEAASTYIKLVNFYQTTRRNTSEDSHLHTRCSKNLKSHWRSLLSLVGVDCIHKPSILSVTKKQRCDTTTIFSLMMFSGGGGCWPWKRVRLRQRFGETQRLLLQGRRWRQYVSLKHCHLPASVHGAKTRKNTITNLTAMKTYFSIFRFFSCQSFPWRKTCFLLSWTDSPGSPDEAVAHTDSWQSNSTCCDHIPCKKRQQKVTDRVHFLITELVADISELRVRGEGVFSSHFSKCYLTHQNHNNDWRNKACSTVQCIKSSNPLLR